MFFDLGFCSNSKWQDARQSVWVWAGPFGRLAKSLGRMALNVCCAG